MKNRTSLFLMELLVMVLVFAIAGAVCLQGLVRADTMSRDIQLRDRAAIFCQNGAQTLKVCRSLPAAAEELGASLQENRWIAFRETEEGLLRLEIAPRTAPVPGMGQAEVTVFSGEGEEVLFSLTVGWQEGSS